MKDTCASCHGLNVTKIIKTDNEKKPKWLAKFDYVTNFIEKNNNKKIKIYKQKKTDTTMVLDVGKSRAGLCVLYWAATPASLRPTLIRNAKAAYSNLRNHGIAKVDKMDMPNFVLTVLKHIILLKQEKNMAKHSINMFIFVFQICL